MTLVWHRLVSVIFRRSPAPNDERQRQARVIALVNIQSEATLARVAKTLRRVGEDLADAKR